ncbi:MAG: SiaC family regulatory phosphoprotein [Bacteroidia bacterium]
MGYRLLTKIYKTKVIFNFEYFNTASSKVIMDIIEKLKILQDNGSQPEIKWYYIEEDDDMLEAGEDYSDITEIPFNFISYQ